MADLHKGLAQGALALYVVQFFRKIVPLISIPYLARILGPSGWGLVAYVMAFSDLLVLVLEFGFNLSATREIARYRDDRERCSEIMSGVLGAQAMLICVGVTLALSIGSFLPLLRDHRNMLLAGCIYAIVQGVAPQWLFQGFERMRLIAVLEISGKLAGLAGLVLFVHRPDDAWKVFAVSTVPAALACAVGFVLAHRTAPLRWPTRVLIEQALRMGWPLFVFRSGESLYGIANSFTLGLFAPAAAVGYFAAAEKLSKASFGMLNPIREVLYPRLSKLIHESPSDAARLARTGVVVLCSGGILISAGLAFWARPLIRLTTGDAFLPAVAALRMFAILPVILSVTYSVGMQTLLPHGKDKLVSKIILVAGAINLAMAAVLAPRFAEIGMAGAVVFSELAVMAMMIRAVTRLGLFRTSAGTGTSVHAGVSDAVLMSQQEAFIQEV
jgi:PST family polysaccharide transporter